MPGPQAQGPPSGPGGHSSHSYAGRMQQGPAGHGMTSDMSRKRPPPDARGAVQPKAYVVHWYTSSIESHYWTIRMT